MKTTTMLAVALGLCAFSALAQEAPPARTQVVLGSDEITPGKQIPAERTPAYGKRLPARRAVSAYSEGPVALWHAEGDGVDSVGKNNAFSLKGVEFAKGLFGRAFKFSGEDSSVNILGSPAFEVGDQVTIEFWMKADPDNQMQSYQGLVTSEFFGVEIANGFSSGMGVLFFISTDGGKTISAASWPNTADANGGGAPVSAGRWHHIAGTYDGTELQLYVDGRPRGQPMRHTGPISPMGRGNFISIGSEEGRTDEPQITRTRYFKGLIDEVAIYNRALSAEEIADNYRADREALGEPVAASPVSTGPVALWHADGNGFDSAGKNDAATLKGVEFDKGVLGQAFRFNGDGASVNVPRSPSLAEMGGQVTVECWVRSDPDNKMNTYQGLVASDYYGLETGNGHVPGGSVGPSFFISTDKGASWIDTADANGGGAVLSPGKWHHIVGTYDGAKVQLYVDGQPRGRPQYVSGRPAFGGPRMRSAAPGFGGVRPVENTTIPLSPPGESRLLEDEDASAKDYSAPGIPVSRMSEEGFVSIGSEEGRVYDPSIIKARYFKGLIDEVAIYNRALSANEIAAIHRVGRGALGEREAQTEGNKD